MKKILCILLCLALLLPAALAAGEAGQSKAADFGRRLVSFFTAFDPEANALKLTIEPPEGDPIVGALAVQGDLVSLKMDLPDMPVELQLNGEAGWLSAAGAVYELRWEDLASLAQSAVPDHTQAWKEMAALFAEKILMPGVSAETGGDGLTIRLNYDAKTLLPALAEFGDVVIDSDEYLNAVLAALRPYVKATDQTMPTPEEARAAWPEGKAMLLAVPADAQLTGELTLKEGAADGCITLSIPGEKDTIAFSGVYNPAAAALTLKVATEGENVREGELITLDFLLDRGKRSLSGVVELPMRRITAKIEGGVSEGVLNGHAEVVAGGFPIYDARLTFSNTGVYRGGQTGSGQLAFTRGYLNEGNTTVVDFDFAPDRFRASCSSRGRTMSFMWSRDREGNFEAALELPNPVVFANLSGRAGGGELQAEGRAYGAIPPVSFTLDCSVPRGHFAFEGSADGNKGSLTLDVTKDGHFTAQAEAVPASGPSPYPVSAKLSGVARRGRSAMLLMDYELNYKGGKWASGHVSAGRKGRDRSLTATLNLFRDHRTFSLQAILAGGRFDLNLQSNWAQIQAAIAGDGAFRAMMRKDRDRMERSLTGGFDDAGDYVLNFELAFRPLYGLTERSHDSHALLRASAQEDRLALSLTEDESEQLFRAELEKTPAQPIEPLSGSGAVRLNKDMLQEMLRQALE